MAKDAAGSWTVRKKRRRPGRVPQDEDEDEGEVFDFTGIDDEDGVSVVQEKGKGKEREVDSRGKKAIEADGQGKAKTGRKRRKVDKDLGFLNGSPVFAQHPGGTSEHDIDLAPVTTLPTPSSVCDFPVLI
jgi:hypothetical protein